MVSESSFLYIVHTRYLQIHDLNIFYKSLSKSFFVPNIWSSTLDCDHRKCLNSVSCWLRRAEQMPGAVCGVEADWADWRLVLMYSEPGGGGGRQTLTKLYSLFTWPDSIANTAQHLRVALTDHINNARISSVSQIPQHPRMVLDSRARYQPATIFNIHSRSKNSYESNSTSH